MVHITSALWCLFFLFHGVILHKQTDKTMAELEIDINMRIREWDVIQVRDALQLCQFISRNDVLPKIHIMICNMCHSFVFTDWLACHVL